MPINEQLLQAKANYLAQTASELAGLQPNDILSSADGAYELAQDSPHHKKIFLGAILAITVPGLQDKVIYNLANYLKSQQPESPDQKHWGARTKAARKKCVSKKPVIRGPKRYSGGN